MFERQSTVNMVKDDMSNSLKAEPSVDSLTEVDSINSSEENAEKPNQLESKLSLCNVEQTSDYFSGESSLLESETNSKKHLSSQFSFDSLDENRNQTETHQNFSKRISSILRKFSPKIREKYDFSSSKACRSMLEEPFLTKLTNFDRQIVFVDKQSTEIISNFFSILNSSSFSLRRKIFSPFSRKCSWQLVHWSTFHFPIVPAKINFEIIFQKYISSQRSRLNKYLVQSNIY